ncbi:putative DNA replication complex GINS protein SLD5 [Hypsibius exemplaris]|uniref:DNA replication complex GINS protein SLD5 n=1 Tax=Hypsibius exemplaris TaxID=2072580 RepID=A0A1W0X473_HYPEX|nr:putative DNA replication complex GINS protein SLD5 [Hypsibius exemplaris]
MDLPEMDVSGVALDDSSTVYTTAQLLTDLKDIWRSERLAPELLPHKQETVEMLLEQIGTVESNLEKAKHVKDPFFLHCHKMEANRVRYMLSNYLRCRLEKLENYALHYLQLSAAERDFVMTTAEYKFLQRYQADTEELIEGSVRTFLPANLAILDKWKEAPLKPRLESFVFVKPREQINGLILGASDAPVSLEQHSQYLLRYSAVRKPVMENKVILISPISSASLQEIFLSSLF